jgi:hypothetical protein
MSYLHVPVAKFRHLFSSFMLFANAAFRPAQAVINQNAVAGISGKWLDFVHKLIDGIFQGFARDKLGYAFLLFVTTDTSLIRSPLFIKILPFSVFFASEM